MTKKDPSRSMYHVCEHIYIYICMYMYVFVYACLYVLCYDYNFI